jgi:Helix-turn-helix of DDE superfamily endonuclease
MILESTHVVIPSKRSLKSYAGVDIETYNVLYKELEIIELERHTTLINKPNRLRQYGGGGKECLLTIDDKLLFILNYFKTYPTMDVMSVKYNISRSSVWNYVHSLSAKLHNILVKLEVMPMREMPSIDEFKAYLEAHKIHQLIIDVTERTIERPSKKIENRAQYSGKKKDIPSKILSLQTSRK